MKCACKGCKNREIGCHSDCLDYKEYCDMNKKRKDFIRLENKFRHMEYKHDVAILLCSFNKYR